MELNRKTEIFYSEVLKKTEKCHGRKVKSKHSHGQSRDSGGLVNTSRKNVVQYNENKLKNNSNTLERKQRKKKLTWVIEASVWWKQRAEEEQT